MISMSHGLLSKLAYGAAVASVAAGTAVGAATLKPESIAGWRVPGRAQMELACLSERTWKGSSTLVSTIRVPSFA